ncbi:hypothetical protein LIER_30399 [Lithospermum erythrorhizon]|uniref:Uncharacterized protein n=1 Tax=Lithospermum erythrorhizon TaxID=34254 RepID=A0AAV3RTC9_LITER
MGRWCEVDDQEWLFSNNKDLPLDKQKTGLVCYISVHHSLDFGVKLTVASHPAPGDQDQSVTICVLPCSCMTVPHP